VLVPSFGLLLDNQTSNQPRLQVFLSGCLSEHTMGTFIWNEWAHFVSMTASVCAVWSTFYAFLYRKFFWDSVDGIVRDPGGIQPGNAALPFVAIIVKLPIIQIFAMLTGIILILVEVPYSPFRATSLHRSFVFRIVLLIQQAALTILLYQGTNAAIYSLIAIFAYTKAIMHGEVLDEAKANRGNGDRGERGERV